jgi:hypothetical protein
MKVYCKKTYFGFKKGKYYNIIQYSSVFERNDFITIQSDESLEHSWYRFRMNKSLEYIDDYIGKDEAYFYDFFINIKSERKKKLLKIGDN